MNKQQQAITDQHLTGTCECSKGNYCTDRYAAAADKVEATRVPFTPAEVTGIYALQSFLADEINYRLDVRFLGLNPNDSADNTGQLDVGNAGEFGRYATVITKLSDGTYRVGSVRDKRYSKLPVFDTLRKALKATTTPVPVKFDI